MADDLKIGGYRKDLENEYALRVGNQSVSQYCGAGAGGEVDPKQLGKPIGVSQWMRIENQRQLNSCAGNSATSILESEIHLQGGPVMQLSRMWAYVKGQQKAGISGDNGATLYGVIQALQEGCPQEQFAPYTGSYFTRFSQEAVNDAPNQQLVSWSAVNAVQQVYEGLAKRVGGLYLGIACTNDVVNCTGVLDHYSEYSTGCHAMAVLDWCERRVSGGQFDGYPYLDWYNSWDLTWGKNGHADLHPAALANMIAGRLSSIYFLSTAKFIKPRFDWKQACENWAV